MVRLHLVGQPVLVLLRVLGLRLAERAAAWDTATWDRLRQCRHQARADIEAMLDSLAYLAGVSPPEAPMTEDPRP